MDNLPFTKRITVRNEEYATINEHMKGTISLKLKANKQIEEFCERYFKNYNRDQFEVVALRFYYGKEIIVTLYALDKIRQDGTNFNHNKLPVKKFKSSTVSFEDILPYVNELNFTLNTGNYSVEDIEVINK
jgi:hypothetical protein